MKIRWMQLVMVAGLMAVGLMGCGGGGNTNDLPDPQVRIINGTPDAVGLDFLLNDSVTAANVDGQRKVWIESIPLLATGPKGRGK